MRTAALFLRFVCFCIFFTIGAAAIVLSILIEPEIGTYYQNRLHLARIDEANARIRRLTEDYDTQIRNLREDPQRLVMLQAITFRQKPVTDGAVLPKASDEKLNAAKEALLREIAQQENQALTPAWVLRVAEPRNRQVTFTAGAALVLTTFIFFGSVPIRRPSVLPRSVLKAHSGAGAAGDPAEI